MISTVLPSIPPNAPRNIYYLLNSFQTLTTSSLKCLSRPYQWNKCTHSTGSDRPPALASRAKALKPQRPQWSKMHRTVPCCTSSKTAESCCSWRVTSLLRLRLCIVRKRPVRGVPPGPRASRSIQSSAERRRCDGGTSAGAAIKKKVIRNLLCDFVFWGTRME